jgi:hypothetical protein
MFKLAFAIFTLALFLQAPPPVPRQGAQNTTAQTNKEKQNRIANQKPAEPGSTVNPQGSVYAKDNNQNKAAEGKQDDVSVKIARLEDGKVSVRKDPWDYIYIGATLAVALTSLVLALAARIQAKAAESQARSAESAAKSAADNAEAANANARAVEAQDATLQKTLMAIQRQADNMEKQTAILQRSIDVIIDKERPRLRVRALDFDPWGDTTTFNSGTVPFQCHVLKLRVSFFGSSTAFVTESNAIARLFDSSEPVIELEKYRLRMQGLPDEITAATVTPIEIPVPIWEDIIYGEATARLPSIDDPAVRRARTIFIGELVAFDADKIKSGKQFIHFNGFIKYRDVFGRDRETTFRLRWQLTLGVTLKGDPAGQWIKWGPQEANRET